MALESDVKPPAPPGVGQDAMQTEDGLAAELLYNMFQGNKEEARRIHQKLKDEYGWQPPPRTPMNPGNHISTPIRRRPPPPLVIPGSK